MILQSRAGERGVRRVCCSLTPSRAFGFQGYLAWKPAATNAAPSVCRAAAWLAAFCCFSISASARLAEKSFLPPHIPWMAAQSSQYPTARTSFSVSRVTGLPAKAEISARAGTNPFCTVTGAVQPPSLHTIFPLPSFLQAMCNLQKRRENNFTYFRP